MKISWSVWGRGKRSVQVRMADEHSEDFTSPKQTLEISPAATPPAPRNTVQMVLPANLPAAPPAKERTGPKLPPPPQWNLTRPKKVKLVEVNPINITFSAPFDVKDQSVTAVVKSVCALPVGYKVKTDQQELYRTKPTKGVIQPGEQATVELVMLTTAQDKMAQALKKKHHFFVQAIEWCKKEAEFKAEVWTEMVDVIGVDIQKVVVRVAHSTEPAKGPGNKGKEVAKLPAGANASARETTSPHAQVEPVNWISPEAKKITFSGPYGQRQSRVLAMTNNSTSPCAFKIQTNKATFYSVKPPKAVLKPKANTNVNFEINEQFTAAELPKASPGSHKFQVQAVKWPDDEKKWDQQTFDEEKEKGCQTFVIDIEHLNEQFVDIDPNA